MDSFIGRDVHGSCFSSWRAFSPFLSFSIRISHEWIRILKNRVNWEWGRCFLRLFSRASRTFGSGRLSLGGGLFREGPEGKFFSFFFFFFSHSIDSIITLLNLLDEDEFCHRRAWRWSSSSSKSIQMQKNKRKTYEIDSNNGSPGTDRLPWFLGSQTFQVYNVLARSESPRPLSQVTTQLLLEQASQACVQSSFQSYARIFWWNSSIFSDLNIEIN
jgi:hypothetical protein